MEGSLVDGFGFFPKPSARLDCEEEVRHVHLPRYTSLFSDYLYITSSLFFFFYFAISSISRGTFRKSGRVVLYNRIDDFMKMHLRAYTCSQDARRPSSIDESDFGPAYAAMPKKASAGYVRYYGSDATVTYSTG